MRVYLLPLGQQLAEGGIRTSTIVQADPLESNRSSKRTDNNES